MTPEEIQEKLDLRVSRETVDKLKTFLDCFEKWSSKINLVGPSTLKDVWDRHICDSLQLAKFVDFPKQWVDLGSGGGFPGVVLAILMSDYPDGSVHLVESNQKKAAFLRAALMETGARGTVHASRIEDVAGKGIKVDVVSARALASLDLLLEYSAGWLSAGSTALFHKGRDYQSEIDKARDRWQFDLVIHPSVIGTDSVILEISGLSRRI